LACIEEVLAMDVRSSFQTNKARRGNYQAERANRIQQTTLQNATGTTTTSIKSTTAQELNDCTQQLDNLLLHCTVFEAPQVQRSTSEGSGAEDQVFVTSIELLC